MQPQADIGFVRILVKMIDPIGIEQRGATLDAMHLVAFGKQQFRKVCAILARNARDQGGLSVRHLGFVPFAR
jgi:hypothetical protein